MSERPSVHVVDDDAGMRKSLRMLMESVSFPVRTYESAEAFLEEASLDRPGCVVLDLRMPGMGGMNLLQRLRELGCVWPVILISGHADVPTAVRGMKLGAVDVLQKPFEPQALVEAVQRAMEEVAHAHDLLLEKEAIRRRMESLTAREKELLHQVVAGKSNKQIAVDLGISIKTVANHRASLMAKVGASNAPDLVRMAMMLGR